jgi:hypothetical protein
MMVNTSEYSKDPLFLEDGNVVAFDVDDTLLMWYIPHDYSGPIVTTYLDGIEDRAIPNQPAIDFLKKLKARNYKIIVWSLGGSVWAMEAVNALGLSRYVDLIMPKIDFHVDDKPNPEDKIGKWNFINLDGNIYSKDKEGKIIKNKPSFPFENFDKKEEQ